MTIELELDPALELEITKAAEVREMPVAEYLQTVLKEHHLPSAIRLPRKRISIQEFLDGMAYHGPIPEEMRTQEITRAFIYGDHP